MNHEELRPIDVLFICGAWNSSKGGLPTFNREFAISLAKTSSDKIRVHCYVTESTEQEMEDARENGVNIITAENIPGTSDPLEWLRTAPPELPHPDIVVGHGRKFGTPAFCIKRTTNCKWVQFVHVFCEDLGKYKARDEKMSTVHDTIEENEKKHKSELQLCEAANVVIAVGSRLQQKYKNCLPGIEVEVITPGILESFCHLSDQRRKKVAHSSDEFSIFVFGRASFEDLTLKGYDIIADAVGSLGETFSITFVGAPEGQHRNMEEWFLLKTRLTRRQLTIRGYCDQEELKRMFFAADMVAMPSRTEGFGLVALEAMSAGVPVLVTSQSGIAKALEKVEGGKSVIVQSDMPVNWAQEIEMLSTKKPEERLETAIQLRENYSKTYSWWAQCKEIAEKIVALGKGRHHGHDFDDAVVHAASDDSSSNSARSTSRVVKRKKPLPSVNMVSEAPRGTLRSGGLEAMDVDRNVESVTKRRKLGGTDDQSTSAAVVHGTSDDSTSSAMKRKKPKPSVNTVSEAPRGTLRSGGSTEDSSAKHANSIEKSKQLRGNRGSTLLHSAAESGNVDTIKRVLSLGLDIDSRDTKGKTPLMVAAFNGKPDAFHFLLERGSDPTLKSNSGSSLLHHAAGGGHKVIIDKLLSLELDIDSRDKDGLTPLMVAAVYGEPDAFHFLLERGADHTLKDNDGGSLLHHAAQGGRKVIIERLLSLELDFDSRDKDGSTPLMIAALAGEPDAFHLLLERGADPTLKANSGWSLLHSAAQGGCKGIIEKLLSLELDADSRDNDGLTPSMVAAFTGQPDAFHLLLERGADPTLKDNDSRSLLHDAAEGGRKVIIEKLLSLELDIDSRDTKGNTPLMIAALAGQPDAFHFLLKRGADHTLKDNNGKSLLHNAAKGGRKVIIEKLLSLGLDIDSRGNDGLTPLMVAASAGEPDAFHFLLERGSDPTLKSNIGRSLLHHAAQGDVEVIMEQLLSLGLDIDSRDRDGETPLNAAASLGKTVALEYLLSKGARP